MIFGILRRRSVSMNYTHDPHLDTSLVQPSGDNQTIAAIVTHTRKDHDTIAWTESRRSD